jgi:hypothetical protein
MKKGEGRGQNGEKGLPQEVGMSSTGTLAYANCSRGIMDP